MCLQLQIRPQNANGFGLEKRFIFQNLILILIGFILITHKKINIKCNLG